MVSERFEFGHGRGFQGARKLLAGKAEPTPAVPVPGPGGSTLSACSDTKTGQVVSCQNPHTLLIIMAGMSCMMVLVTVALLLLCWSFVKQRRIERRFPRSGREQQSDANAPQGAPGSGHSPADSPEYDDAVFVQLPGDEKPRFFAVPKPFLVDGEKDAENEVGDSTGDVNSGEKELSQARPAVEVHNAEQQTDNPSDGVHRNSLFAR